MIPSPWLVRSSIDPFWSNSPPENSVLVFLFVCLFCFRCCCCCCFTELHYKVLFGTLASGVNVLCNSENMTIIVPKSLLLGMDRDHLRLLDTSCKATQTSTHFSLTTPLTGCNTTSRHTSSAIVYSNAVLEIPVAVKDVVTRVREIEIKFSCFYSKYGVVSSVGWKPRNRKLVFNDEGKGNFTLSLNMFPDNRFVSPYMKNDFPVAVVLRKLLFFEVSVISDDKQLSIRADRCYATPTQDQKSSLKYEFIKSGYVIRMFILWWSKNNIKARCQTRNYKQF